MAIIEINWHPTRRELKRFALLWLPLFCAAVGAIIYARVSVTAGYSLWVAGAATAVLGLWLPIFIRWVYLGLIVLTYPIGFVVSHILMAAIFYLAIPPSPCSCGFSATIPCSKAAAPSKAPTGTSARKRAIELAMSDNLSHHKRAFMPPT